MHSVTGIIDFNGMVIATDEALILPALLAIAAGWTDYRTQRIPNWLTVTALLLGIAANSWKLRGWAGAKDSLLGAGLGLAILSAPVLIRIFGAGDWKFVGALGACLGTQNLLTVLAACSFGEWSDRRNHDSA